MFPVLFQLWWFASIYFWLFILHPYLNRLLRGLSKGEYKKLLVVLLISFCVIPSIIRISYHAQLLWFVILYTVAGYIRLHGEILHRINGSSFYLVAAAGLFCLMTGMRMVGIALEGKIPIFASHTASLGEMHNGFTFLIALCLFMVFRKIAMGYHWWINFLASATFGVYLIHDHPAVRHILWRYFFLDVEGFVGIVLSSILAVASVYFSGVAIDLVRIHLFERPFLKLIPKFVCKKN